MEIKLADLILTSEFSSISKTRIIIKKDGVKIADIDSVELRVAIIALEKSCWRP